MFSVNLLNITVMKTPKRVNIKIKGVILLGFLLSIMLSVSPVQGSDKSGEDGSDIYIEEWMTLPFEVVDADYDAELEIEEWMTEAWI